MFYHLEKCYNLIKKSCHISYNNQKIFLQKETLEIIDLYLKYYLLESLTYFKISLQIWKLCKIMQSGIWLSLKRIAF